MKEIKTKKIKSKKEKTLIKIDIVFILVCLIIVKINMKVSIVVILFKYFKIYDGNFIAFINILLAILWMLVILLISKCFILIATYLAFRISRMKVIKENSRYKVIDNIEYYRKRFNNITPAEISLITDLEIETKKDISATILDLYQKEIIDFYENNIIIKNEDKALRQSEQKLVEMIKSNDFSKENIDEWKKTCIKEAQENNYIKVKIDKEKRPNFSKNNMVINISAKLFIISLILSLVFLFTPTGEKWYTTLDEFDNKYAQEDKTELEIIKNNQDVKELYVKIISGSGPIMILSTVMIITFFVLIGTPIYRKARRKIYNKIEVNNSYERTREGKILVEQIAGIKNYIHDFSLLSEKDKENIVLWEDFLIYAVVLEENEIIINDIYRYRNINQNILSNIKQVINI